MAPALDGPGIFGIFGTGCVAIFAVKNSPIARLVIMANRRQRGMRATVLSDDSADIRLEVMAILCVNAGT